MTAWAMHRDFYYLRFKRSDRLHDRGHNVGDVVRSRLFVCRFSKLLKLASLPSEVGGTG